MKTSIDMGRTEKGEPFRLPTDAVTQTFAFLARRGAGKTYAASKLCEEMHAVGAQVVVLDPVGNWYGLRLAADGKGKGLPIPVLGGLHGDIPLEPAGGAVVADLVVDRTVSLILDVSMFRKGDRKRFATEFAEQLFHRKKSARSAMHLFIEEAQVFVPQRAGGDEARLLGAYEDLIKLGRNFGIGVTLISQRPQSVNKDALNQTEALFALQINGSQERKALKEWVVDQGLDVDLVEELPRLPVGTAYVWSPQWLGVLSKVKIGSKATFNASATPEVGKSAASVGELAPVDLAALRDKMAATIEHARANDPAELKRQVATLKRELSARPATVDEAAVGRAVEAARREWAETERKLHAAIEQLRAGLQEVAKVATVTRDAIEVPVVGTRSAPTAGRATLPQPARKAPAVPSGNGPGEKLSKAERAILTCLAQFGESTKRKVALVAGYALSGGGFRNALGALRSADRITDEPDGRLAITSAGADALGRWEPLPTGRELLNYWMDNVSKCEGEILTVLAAAYPQALEPEAIAARTSSGYTATGGGFRNSLGALRTLELVQGYGQVRLSAELHDED